MRTPALALLGLACLFVGFVFSLILPGLRAYAWAILAVGAALLALAVIADFRRVRRALASRQGRYGLGTAVKVALFGGIVLLANAIGVAAYHRFDFTGLSQFTLTSQTRQVLAALKEPVEAVNFYSPSVSAEVSSYARNLLAEYQNYTRRLTVRDVDPDLNPDQARQYQVDRLGAQYGVTVFRGPDGLRQVYGPQVSAEAEHAFTSAILEVTGVRQRKVYFLTGHGESDIQADYDSARSGLRDNLFQVDQLDLLQTPRIPQDAAVIVVAGPRQPPAASELSILKAYLSHGGRMFLLLDPGAPRAFQGLLRDWGLDFADGTMIDPASYLAPDQDTPLVPRTRNHFGLPQTYFPGAAAILPQKTPPKNLTIVPLVWTSPQSWLASAFTSGKVPRFDERTDRRGPLALGALVSLADQAGASQAGTDAASGMRLAVMADSDFAANRHFQNGNNGDLFLSTVNWLAAGVDILAMDRKVLPMRRLILSSEEARFLQVSSIALLPVVLLIIAGALWWRRR